MIPDAAASGLSLRLARHGRDVLARAVSGEGPSADRGPRWALPRRHPGRCPPRTAKIVAAAKGGKDLIEEEKRQREAAARAKARARTVAEVAEDFLRGSERLKSYRQRASYTRNHIVPAIGDRIVGEVRRADIIELLDAVEGRGLKQTINRVRETLLRFFEFAVERQLADANPVAGSRRQGSKSSASAC